MRKPKRGSKVSDAYLHTLQLITKLTRDNAMRSLDTIPKLVDEEELTQAFEATRDVIKQLIELQREIKHVGNRLGIDFLGDAPIPKGARSVFR